MIERIHLRGAPQRPWHHSGSVHATGWGYFADGRVLSGVALAAALDGGAEAFASRISRLSGDFAAVHVGADVVVAAVDRIRSIPLFYGRRAGGMWVLSDDARWAGAALGARVDDPAAAAELMLTGATSGPSTLAPPLLQVQAGGAVTLTPGGAGTHRYFRYADGEPLDADEDALAERGAAVLGEAFDRMLESARGRPLALPLSGGRDSRLVAALLVARGRTDAIAYSYGRPGNAEAQASRRVARALGLPWHFVPYSARGWAMWRRRDDFQRFRREATGLSAIEHEQDWPAVLSLREAGTFPADTIVVPGHAGDFLGGSHFPALPAAFEADPVEWIWQRYYTHQWPVESLPADLVNGLRARIDIEIEGAPSAAAAFARHGWQERQAKMIANSVRVYEHHGMDWRLPFWSHPPVLDFWSRLPVALRRGGRFYRRVLRSLTGVALDDLPVPGRRPPVAATRVRLTDRDLGRYGLWMGAHPLLRGLRMRLGDLVRVEEPAISAVVESIVGPWKRLPPQRALINGLLALGQLNDLANGRPLEP